MDRAKSTIEKLLAEADVKINGGRPWDIKVNDERLYHAVLRGGSLAFGESYMSGWWDCDAHRRINLPHIYQHDLLSKVRFTPANIALYLGAMVGNFGKKGRRSRSANDTTISATIFLKGCSTAV